MYLYTADGNPSGELIYPVQVNNPLNGTDIDQGSVGETQREQCDHPGHTRSCSERESCQGSGSGQHGDETSGYNTEVHKEMKKWYMKMTKQGTEDERKSVENYEEKESLEEQNMQETEQDKDRSKEARQKGLS